jgi:hypothetical protein
MKNQEQLERLTYELNRYKSQWAALYASNDYKGFEDKKQLLLDFYDEKIKQLSAEIVICEGISSIEFKEKTIQAYAPRAKAVG